MFSHMDKNLRGHMVDISEKDISLRQARAGGSIKMQKKTLEALAQLQVEKGDVLAVAQIAAIQGAKKTPDFIPLAHPILLQGVAVNFEYEEEGIYCEVTVKSQGKTGVEMEALTACSAALLTIYDMCKALDKTMEITGISLLEKTGGRSAYYEKK